MDKALLNKEVTRLEELADKNYRLYQETGDSRYDRYYNRYSDQADVYRVAANAADEHNELIHLRSTVGQIVGRCKDLSWKTKEEQDSLYRNAVKELLSYWGW